MLVEIDGDDLTFQTISDKGTTIDQGTIHRVGKTEPTPGRSRSRFNPARRPRPRRDRDRWGGSMIRKLGSGGYRLYSRKADPKTGRRRNLGTFPTRAAAEKHERAVQFFKRRG